jgi:hypothetical protein
LTVCGAAVPVAAAALGTVQLATAVELASGTQLRRQADLGKVVLPLLQHLLRLQEGPRVGVPLLDDFVQFVLMLQARVLDHLLLGQFLRTIVALDEVGVGAFYFIMILLFQER